MPRLLLHSPRPHLLHYRLFEMHSTPFLYVVVIYIADCKVSYIADCKFFHHNIACLQEAANAIGNELSDGIDALIFNAGKQEPWTTALDTCAHATLTHT